MIKALYELRKFLPTLLMPFSLSLVLIAIGLGRRRRAAALAGLVLLFLVSLRAVSDSLCYVMENQYPHLQAAQCPLADVVVALSGYADEKKRFPGEIQWNDAVARFEVAVQLVRAQKAPILLFTDAQLPTDDRHNSTADLVRRAAVEHGVSESAVRLTRPVTTTSDEAQAVRDYLRQNEARRVILVTSAFHMARAALLFRRAGIEFVPFPAAYESPGWEWKLNRFEPSVDALARADRNVHEIYGNLFYRLMPFQKQ